MVYIESLAVPQRQASRTQAKQKQSKETGVLNGTDHRPNQ